MHRITKYILVCVFISMILIFINMSFTNINQVVLMPIPYKNDMKQNNLGIVILDENTSTGYRWHYEISNKKVLKLKSNHVFIPKNTLLGQKAKHIWKFEPLSTGETNIIFKYYRDWEENDVIKEHKYIINITEK